MSSLLGRSRSGQRGRRRAMAEINVVPYIDVMLVLLVIFMVSAPLLSPSIINLPHASNTTQPPAQVIELSLDKQEQYKLKLRGKGATQQGERSSSLKTLAQDIRSYNMPSDTPVVISADRDLKYEKIVQTMDELRLAGYAKVGLLTSPNP